MNPLEKALQEEKEAKEKSQSKNKEEQKQPEEQPQNVVPKKVSSPLDMIFEQEEVKENIKDDNKETAKPISSTTTPPEKKAKSPLDMIFDKSEDKEEEPLKTSKPIEEPNQKPKNTRNLLDMVFDKQDERIEENTKETAEPTFNNPLNRTDSFSETEMNKINEELENTHKTDKKKSENNTEYNTETDFFKKIEFSEDLPAPKVHLNGFAKKQENQNKNRNSTDTSSLEEKVSSIQRELEMEAELLGNTYLKDANSEKEEKKNVEEGQKKEIPKEEKSEVELLTDEVNDTEEQIQVEALFEQEIEEQKPTVAEDEKTEIRKSYSEEKMIFDRTDISNEQLIHLYKALLRPRLIEDRMLIALRQGKISKWFSGYGQEAISVGIAETIQKDEYLLPLHRNLGLFTSRKIELEKLFAQFQGKKEGFTKGRDRSFHFGTNEHHIVGMISHLGPQLTVANGIALADILENKKRITVTFTGDGGTSQGDFHEALNVAAVWDLPTIFVVENNGYGLSTPSHEQFRCKQFIDKGIGYGMKAVQVDGNNILEVYSTVKKLAKEMRENPHPVLLEMITFRMRGHEEASGTKYVPKELFEVWEKKDPVTNYEKFLIENNVLTEEKAKEIREGFFENIKNALDIALELPKIVPNTEEEITDMYAPHEQELIAPISSNQTSKRLIDAISDSLRQSMERYPKMTIMGQDVADYGGVFKITDGFVEKFGKERVRNTPLCESAIVGASLGLSIRGWKSVMEMQFADFVTCGFNQIINNLAKSHYRWNQNADVVVRMPTGAGVAAGPFHSQSNEAWFAHTPGLKVVYPSSPYDAKGLLNASIEDPNPVIFFEHKALYRAISEDIYDDYYTLPIGKAALVSEGEDISIITYGMGVHWAKKAAQELNEELGENHSLEILDLRTLLPWDKEAVAETVKKTGKVIILHEDCLTGGIGGEISAWIAEHHFKNLDAPIMREGSLDTAVPFSAELEKNFLPYERFVEKVKKLLQY